MKYATAIASLTLAASSSQAATILWGAATTISGDLDVSTAGTFVYAEHWSGTNDTVNGVAFTAAQNNVVGSGTVGTEDGHPVSGSLSTAYANILKGAWYNAGGKTITLNNLTITQQYQVQIWVADGRYNPDQFTTITGGPSLQVDSVVGNPNTGFGQFAIGTFTADGTTQTIGIDSGSDIVNAVSVRAIPEPSAALLGGLGMLCLLRRRR